MILKIAFFDEFWGPFYRCPFCGEEKLNDDFNFCPVCGMSLESFLFEKEKKDKR